MLIPATLSSSHHRRDQSGPQKYVTSLKSATAHEDVNKADQNVTGNDNNANNSTETTQRHQLTRDILFPNLESVRNEQNYNPVSLSTTEKLLLVVWKAKSLQIYWSKTYFGC